MLRLFAIIFLHWTLVIGHWTFALPSPPQRIVSGIPSATEMLYALDLGERVVGVTSNCNYPPAAQKKAKIGRFNLNLETIVSLKPDLVIMLEGAQNKEIKRFKDFGLPVYTMKLTSLNDIMAEINNLGQAAGQAAAAETLVAGLNQRLVKVKEKFKPSLFDILRLWDKKGKKALVIVGFNPLVVAGQGTFIDDILRCAGASNVALATLGDYPQYSFEKLVAEDPDYIIIVAGVVSAREIKKSQQWRSLTAVKKDQIMFIKADIISRPGPRVVDAVEQIADFLY